MYAQSQINESQILNSQFKKETHNKQIHNNLIILNNPKILIQTITPKIKIIQIK